MKTYSVKDNYESAKQLIKMQAEQIKRTDKILEESNVQIAKNRELIAEMKKKYIS